MLQNCLSQELLAMFAFGMRHLFFMRFTGIPHHLKGKGSNMEPWVSMRFLVRSLKSEHDFCKVIQVTSLGYVIFLVGGNTPKMAKDLRNWGFFMVKCLPRTWPRGSFFKEAKKPCIHCLFDLIHPKFYDIEIELFKRWVLQKGYNIIADLFLVVRSFAAREKCPRTKPVLDICVKPQRRGMGMDDDYSLCSQVDSEIKKVLSKSSKLHKSG